MILIDGTKMEQMMNFEGKGSKGNLSLGLTKLILCFLEMLNHESRQLSKEEWL